MVIAVLQLVFLASVSLVFYVYIGFPLVLFLLTRWRKTASAPHLHDDDLPRVSFLVAAYNEERVIEQKILNGLALDYPPEKLEFVFVSDSTDSTNSILLRYQSDRVRVKILPERGGKVKALKAAFPLCKGEVIVFADANTYYRPDAVRRLVRHFSDPQVGVVTGDVRLMPSPLRFGQGEGLYYRYERYLQRLETAFWSTVAIDGGMYALRRELYRPPSSGLIADDFVTAMNVACEGKRVLYDGDAIADEDPTPSDEMEFKRKVRVVAYAVQSVAAGEGVPSVRHFRLWWTLMSHKVLRWCVPIFLMSAFVTSLAVADVSMGWRVVFASQVLFYALAAAGWYFPSMKSHLFRVPYYFVMVNLAALFGIVRGLRRGQPQFWARTERTV